MPIVIVVLATVMAIFAVIGYAAGTKATLLTTVVLGAGLLLIARAGGSIANVVNGIYFGIRFVLAGGIQASATSGDKSAAIARVVQGMGPAQSLVAPDMVGAELAVVLLVLVLLSVWLGRSTRLKLRGPASIGGLFFGLLNGYVVGAYLLAALVPDSAGSLPLPFGLNAQAGAAQPSASDLTKQIIRSVESASTNMLGFIVMALIALFLVVAAFLSTRGSGGRASGRSRHDGTR
jgi:hypothetical protein